MATHPKTAVKPKAKRAAPKNGLRAQIKVLEAEKAELRTEANTARHKASIETTARDNADTDRNRASERLDAYIVCVERALDTIDVGLAIISPTIDVNTSPDSLSVEERLILLIKSQLAAPQPTYGQEIGRVKHYLGVS